MKKVISLVLLFVFSMSITVSAEGYIYTQDGTLHDVETQEAVIDNIIEYYDIGYELYVLKPDKTLWHTMPDKFSFIFATDNVEKFVAQESPRTCAVIKTDGSLWMWGENNNGIIAADEEATYIEKPTMVMNNVKDVIIASTITMCVTNDGKLYTWGLKHRMETGEEQGVGTPEMIMEDVEKIYSDGGGGYYAIKTDGSLWAWGRNEFQHGVKAENVTGWSIILIDNLLGVNSDKYEIYTPTRVPIEKVTGLSFEHRTITAEVGSGTFHFSTIAYTNSGTTHIWGNDNKTFDKAWVVKANSKTLLSSEGTLYLWDGRVVAENVSDMSDKHYITKNGEIYSYNYTAYTGILNKNLNDENVKCILDYSNFLYLKNDTTLVKGEYQHNKEVVCSNVYDAFYYKNTLYVIDNAFTLYKVWGNGELTAVLHNVSRNNVNIKVLMNGEKVDMDTLPYIKNDRTMVPMRAIFEALGAEVTWDNETRTAIGVKDGTQVKITIGENVLYKNGEEINLDAPAEITNDRTMVPVRAIGEAFGCKVSWNNDMKTVEITN